MTEKQPRFRSPPFPYIGLSRALEKAEQLYNSVRHHSAALATAAKAWETGAKSSATLQTIAALIQYGLLDDEGSGDSRKIKLSNLALKIVMDKRPESEERRIAIRESALNPPIFLELNKQFNTALDIDTSLLLHSLTVERMQKGRAPFSEQSAADVVRVYRDTMKFAGFGQADRIDDEAPAPDVGLSQSDRGMPVIEVGAFVQWVPNGVAQFVEPRRVRAISDNGEWVFIDGSETGIALADLEIIQSTTKADPPRMALPEDDPTVLERIDSRDRNRMKVVWEGELIHINATVDREGLEKLRLKLDAMETLLDG